MNPNRGGEQPASQIETAPSVIPEQYGEDAEKIAERPATPEISPSRQSAPPVPLPPIPHVQNPLVVTTTTNDSSTAVSTPAASDSDRIEREWVDKAKAIIAQTKDDPFVQKSEMSKIKAAYIEKRFNKKVKTDEAIV